MAVSISVVIPTLNEEKHLPKLLKDLKAQTMKDFEVIVVDANSEDQTCEKATKYEEDLNLRLILSPKRHLAFQRNFGAKKSKGAFLLFLDADMHLNKNFMKMLQEEILSSNFLIYLPKHLPHDAEYIDELLYKVIGVFTDLSHKTNKPFAYGPAAIFQREFFQHLGGYDEEIFVYEDHEIIQRAKKQGVNAKPLDTTVFFSFRRFQSEGRINVLSKYTIATLHLLATGKIDKKIFTYEMGGNATYLLKEQKDFDLQKNVKTYFDRLTQLLQD